MDDDTLAYEVAAMITDEIGDRWYHASEEDPLSSAPVCDRQPGETDNVAIFLLKDGRRVRVTVEVLPA